MRRIMPQTLTDYTTTSAFFDDLRITTEIWTAPEVLGTAGLFIFLSYITIPALTGVQPSSGNARSVTMKTGLDSEREKRFLCRMIGLEQDPEWSGGIGNPRVQTLVAELGNRHLHYNGMHHAYMDYFAGIVALSAIEVYSSLGYRLSPPERLAYWRYMQHASSLLGCRLQDVDHTRTSCTSFAAHYTTSNAEGALLLAELARHYGKYLKRALPALFPSTRQAVNQLMVEAQLAPCLEAIT